MWEATPTGLDLFPKVDLLWGQEPGTAETWKQEWAVEQPLVTHARDGRGVTGLLKYLERICGSR